VITTYSHAVADASLKTAYLLPDRAIRVCLALVSLLKADRSRIGRPAAPGGKLPRSLRVSVPLLPTKPSVNASAQSTANGDYPREARKRDRRCLSQRSMGRLRDDIRPTAGSSFL